jgi:hypothetical protein
MKKKSNNKQFDKGYYCALATIVKSHGYETPVREALRCVGMPKRNVNIDDYDLGILTDCGAVKELREHQRKNRAAAKGETNE